MLLIPPARQQERLNRLFDFIKKSQLVNEVLPAISSDDENLDLMHKAIITGDFDADVFRLTNADTYVLYLLKDKRISYDDGMTAYLYLMCYMQYHENGQLKPTDQAFHASREMGIRRLVERGNNGKQQLTPDGQAYVDTLLDFINSFRKEPLSEQEVKAFLFAAPPSQQQLIHVGHQKPNTTLSSEANDGLTTIYELGSLVKIFGDFGKFHESQGNFIQQFEFNIPPTSLMDYIVLQISQKNPGDIVLPLYVFGIANSKTLSGLHQAGWRIVSLYSQFVKNNLLKGHLIAMGPVGTLCHDLLHSIAMQLISNNKYLFLSGKMVPLFWKFSALQQNSNVFNSEVADLIANALDDHNYLSGYDMKQGRFNFDEKLHIDKYLQESLSLLYDEKIVKGELQIFKLNRQDKQSFNDDVAQFAEAICDFFIRELIIDNTKELGAFKATWEGIKKFLSSGSNQDIVVLFDQLWKKMEHHYNERLLNARGYTPRFLSGKDNITQPTKLSGKNNTIEPNELADKNNTIEPTELETSPSPRKL